MIESLSEKIINSNLEEVNIDIDAGSVELSFYLQCVGFKKVTFCGILFFNYKPDFSDEPPWLCLDFMCEKIHSKEDITETLLFKKTSKVYNTLKYPLFEVTLGSADFSLKTICQSITIVEENIEASTPTKS